MRPHIRYAVSGILLGLGAPLGALVLRVIVQGPPHFWTTLNQEWQNASFFYSYMTLGTITAFGAFGYRLGWLNEDLKGLSITDGLTSLYNHRYMQEYLAKEISRSDRYKTLLTCLMLDIDDFKKVNDTYGHPFGDKILRNIAALIRGAVRETDRVGRYGGEEFLVIMPETTGEAALPLAQRILSAVSKHEFLSDGSPVHVTISIGLATYPAPQDGVKTSSGILSAADQALYKAKRTGKNRMEIWHT